MAKKRRKNNTSDDGASEVKRELIRDAGGHDWGWPSLGLVSANPELVRRLHAGGFSGCAYGLTSESGPPFIALAGENLAAMKSALELMREWIDVVGPNAVAVEILLDGPGYVISISQQHDLLRWRLSGLDTADRSLVITMAISKRMDTRHPFLENLAHYSRQPVAPVVLTAAALPPNAKLRFGTLDPASLHPVMDGAITLPGVNIYARPEDRPRDSMVKLETESPQVSTREWPPEPAKDPLSLGHARERRLMATFPKTMHVLRHRAISRSVFEQGQVVGCAHWQIEQAICNLRLADYLPYQPRSTTKRLRILEQLRQDVVEHASISFEVSAIDANALLHQVTLDAAYLLRRLESNRDPPEGLTARNARLRELGYA